MQSHQNPQPAIQPAIPVSNDVLRALAQSGLARTGGFLSDEDMAALNVHLTDICTELLQRRDADAQIESAADFTTGMLEHMLDESATMQAQIKEMSTLLRGMHTMPGGPQPVRGAG